MARKYGKASGRKVKRAMHEMKRGKLKMHKRLRDRGGRLVVSNLAPKVYEVFEVTRLHTLLDIRPAGSDGAGC